MPPADPLLQTRWCWLLALNGRRERSDLPGDGHCVYLKVSLLRALVCYVESECISAGYVSSLHAASTYSEIYIMTCKISLVDETVILGRLQLQM